DHSPLKSADKSCFQSGDFRWWTIAGKNDLSTSFVQCVEGVKKLFLGCLFSAFQKMNVVDEQQIGFAIPPAKLCTASIENRADQLIHELHCSDVGNACRWATLHSLVCESLHQMRLAQPRINVDD